MADCWDREEPETVIEKLKRQEKELREELKKKTDMLSFLETHPDFKEFVELAKAAGI
jgi:hypothetical protein